MRLHRPFQEGISGLNRQNVESDHLSDILLREGERKLHHLLMLSPSGKLEAPRLIGAAVDGGGSEFIPPAHLLIDRNAQNGLV